VAAGPSGHTLDTLAVLIEHFTENPVPAAAEDIDTSLVSHNIW
jgi:hypothetical protein